MTRQRLREQLFEVTTGYVAGLIMILLARRLGVEGQAVVLGGVGTMTIVVLVVSATAFKRPVRDQFRLSDIPWRYLLVFAPFAVVASLVLGLLNDIEPENRGPIAFTGGLGSLLIGRLLADFAWVRATDRAEPSAGTPDQAGRVAR